MQGAGEISAVDFIAWNMADNKVSAGVFAAGYAIFLASHGSAEQCVGCIAFNNDTATGGFIFHHQVITLCHK
jgi:hypothetical protein